MPTMLFEGAGIPFCLSLGFLLRPTLLLIHVDLFLVLHHSILPFIALQILPER